MPESSTTYADILREWGGAITSVDETRRANAAKLYQELRAQRDRDAQLALEKRRLDITEGLQTEKANKPTLTREDIITKIWRPDMLGPYTGTPEQKVQMRNMLAAYGYKAADIEGGTEWLYGDTIVPGIPAQPTETKPVSLGPRPRMTEWTVADKIHNLSLPDDDKTGMNRDLSHKLFGKSYVALTMLEKNQMATYKKQWQTDVDNAVAADKEAARLKQQERQNAIEDRRLQITEENAARDAAKFKYQMDKDLATPPADKDFARKRYIQDKADAAEKEARAEYIKTHNLESYTMDKNVFNAQVDAAGKKARTRMEKQLKKVFGSVSTGLTTGGYGTPLVPGTGGIESPTVQVNKQPAKTQAFKPVRMRRKDGTTGTVTTKAAYDQIIKEGGTVIK